MNDLVYKIKMEIYNPSRFDYTRDYDERYRLFKEYLLEFRENLYIVRNFENYDEIFLNEKSISRVTSEDVRKIGEGLNSYPLHYVKHEGEGQVNKYKIWVIFVVVLLEIICLRL